MLQAQLELLPVTEHFVPQRTDLDSALGQAGTRGRLHGCEAAALLLGSFEVPAQRGDGACEACALTLGGTDLTTERRHLTGAGLELCARGAHLALRLLAPEASRLGISADLLEVNRQLHLRLLCRLRLHAGLARRLRDTLELCLRDRALLDHERRGALRRLQGCPGLAQLPAQRRGRGARVLGCGTCGVCLLRPVLELFAGCVTVPLKPFTFLCCSGKLAPETALSCCKLHALLLGLAELCPCALHALVQRLALSPSGCKRCLHARRLRGAVRQLLPHPLLPLRHLRTLHLGRPELCAAVLQAGSDFGPLGSRFPQALL
mmetsp:Transcript_94056/g.303852  ORF Transcript_94056/g.303852 Transcript_94056/m.303852 type:complete len:319 (+) Transcript_94056:1383-2339(+)